jgi:hypothetical protein
MSLECRAPAVHEEKAKFYCVLDGLLKAMPSEGVVPAYKGDVARDGNLLDDPCAMPPLPL